MHNYNTKKETKLVSTWANPGFLMGGGVQKIMCASLTVGVQGPLKGTECSRIILDALFHAT